MELHNGNVSQARIIKNQPAPVEVKNFIEQWKQQVLFSSI
ncbi:hypothetical protein CLOSTMETH_02042 [[Clostridium] methylpentosum DSM 5476]|uniref:Uncharacterized protein n=1 Tax=[Clostridium] methylpentosum DSM 5476 TaxID=537013 RepID=C0EDW3_9FIRM|nr:hypothetical protein CLOSTMETH_02042 [[Clostridium] methylpentosum DSM 5476]